MPRKIPEASSNDAPKEGPSKRGPRDATPEDLKRFGVPESVWVIGRPPWIGSTKSRPDATAAPQGPPTQDRDPAPRPNGPTNTEPVSEYERYRAGFLAQKAGEPCDDRKPGIDPYWRTGWWNACMGFHLLTAEEYRKQFGI
jgi:hypothetical protein